ncbi:MAG: protein BatD [Chlorobaculum sp.]|nr:protein BatD [Chlorobaculum sp.]
MLRRLRHYLLPLLLLLSASNAQAANAGNTSGGKLFIESSLDNGKPWVGQEVRLTYTLFFSGTAPQIEDKGQPEHPGLWVREIAPENYIDSAPVSKNGVLVRKAVIKQLRLVPMQSGMLSVANYRLRCLVPQSGAASLDSRNDVESIVTAPTATLQARALPKPAPADFNGAVGHFTLAVSPESSTAHTGEPLILSVTIIGKGNLDTPPPLTVMLPEGIQRDASATSPAAPSQKGAISSISTKITVTASKEGAFRFVPIKLTVFDPETGRYETVASHAIAIKVIAGQAAMAAPPPHSIVAPPREEVEQAGALVNTIIVIMAVAVLAVIFGLHIRYMKRHQRPATTQNNPETVKASKPAAPPAPAPQPSTRKKTPASMRNELFEAIKKIGIRNPSGLTLKELSKELEEKMVKAQTVAAITELLSGIDHALYAPGDVSAEKLESMNREATRIITVLSKH